MVSFRGEHLGGGVVVGLATGLIALGEKTPHVVEVGMVGVKEEGGEGILVCSWNPVTKLVEGNEEEEVGRKVGNMLAGVLVSVRLC